MKPEIKDIILLIQQNFALLNVGLFLSEYIKKNNLSTEAKNIVIGFEKGKTFSLNGEFIRNLLSDSYINSEKINVLGYFIEWNAFRGIFMAMREGVCKNSEFKEYLKIELGESRYFHFDVIIGFCRNILSHNIDNNIRLSKEYFDKIKVYVGKDGISTVDFAYNYDIDFKNKKFLASIPRDYSFEIKVDFSKMKVGDEFLKQISEYNMFMLSELCYNLAQSYYKE